MFAPSTRLTYASRSTMLPSASCTCVFCFFVFFNLADITPVPLSQDFVCRYTAFLSERLSYNSIKQYINVVRILHLEAGHVNPFISWHIDTLLKGTKRVLGVSIKQKLPITVDILRRMFTLVVLSCPLDVTFWASCLVAFSPFFGILISWLKIWIILFTVYTCVAEMLIFLQMELLFCSLVEAIPVPVTYFARSFATCRGFPLCPSQALILSVRLCNSPPWAPLFTFLHVAVGCH